MHPSHRSLSPKGKWVLPRKGHRGVLLALGPCIQAEASARPQARGPFQITRLSCFPPWVWGVLLLHRAARVSWRRRVERSRQAAPCTKEQQVGLPLGPGHTMCRFPQQRAQDEKLPPFGLTFVKKSSLCSLAIFNSRLLGFHSQRVLTLALAAL